MVFIIISVLWDCNNFNPLFQLSESQAINQRGTAGSICRLFRRVFDAHMTFCNTDTWQHVDLKPTTKHAQAWVRMKERMNVADVSWITECLAGRHSDTLWWWRWNSILYRWECNPGSLQANEKNTVPYSWYKPPLFSPKLCHEAVLLNIQTYMGQMSFQLFEHKSNPKR